MNTHLTPLRLSCFAILMACSGSGILLLLAIGLRDPTLFGEFIVQTFIGAGLGGLIVSPGFGVQNPIGVLWSLFAGLIATLIGAALAMVFSGMFELIFWAPVFLLALILSVPSALVLWGVSMIGLHYLAHEWRREM